MGQMAEVRIDKYLWAIRVYKTRADATDACKGNKVHINGGDAKPSKSVKPGDVITVRKNEVTFTFRVINTIEKRIGAKLVPEYAENITPQEELEKLRRPIETFFLKRERGTGRPTKKERREMDDLWDRYFFDSEDVYGEEEDGEEEDY